MHKLNHEKSSPKFWATTSVIFKKLPTVNNHPMGENSPNLFTLRDDSSAPPSFSATTLSASKMP
jgi:hypothetical protein